MNKKFFGLGVALFVFGACSKSPDLKVVKAAKVSVESTVSTVTAGTVDAEQQAVLGFGTTGRVARILVKLGDRVKRGQIIAELENADLRAALVDAEGEFERGRELFNEKLISQAGMDSARRTFESARIGLERSIIRAPFDGMVAELSLQVGELPQSTSALSAGSSSTAKAPVRLVDMKPRLVKGDIDEVDLPKVKVGAPARLKILAVRPEPFKGKVTKVISYVGTTRDQDRSAQIEMSFTDAVEGLPVGASTDVEVVVASKENVLAVPARAVLGAGDARYVFRFKDGKLVKASVKTGIGNYDRMEILEGVSEGDEIALPSADVELYDGQKVKVSEEKWP